MKKNRIIISLLAGLLILNSCAKWLEQEDIMGMSPENAYSSDPGITSIVANLYSRLHF